MIHSSSSQEYSETSMEESPDRLTNLSDCVLLPIKICGIQWKNLRKQLPTRSLTSSPPDPKEDRLSNLPDCILLHILSLLNIKEAIHTCIVSKRWRNLWKHLPSLSLSSSDFPSIEGFTKFVSQILSQRDASTSLHALKLDSKILIKQPGLFERILKYAVSHNIQHLQIVGNHDFELFRSCFASCHTLTSLSVFNIFPHQEVIFSKYLNFPALRSLHISNVIFPDGDDPFSAFPKLNTLTIAHFQILGEQNLSITSATLLELTIQSYSVLHKIKLSTPNLCTISLIGFPFQILSGSHLTSVKHVYIDTKKCLLDNFVKPLLGNLVKPLSDLRSWFLELTNIKSLTISTYTLQVLSLVPDLLKVEFPSLCNLKLLNIEMKPAADRLSNKLIDTKLILDYLLQNSPSAKVRFIKFAPKRNIDYLAKIVSTRIRIGAGGSVRQFFWQDEQ
ncbi:FBD-associated F-box protein At5g18780 [Lathyrus oleraceus]|uniref:F-box domain-containing protein n=1 Tax=Pisum sativum TaxID=3888 RepID=A0A9D5AJ44_PEA|nr:FBD-associated F-box protein At5g18780-like [Pisum sativum]KAI5410663.1 hypothetical protein KIW84_055980 [Pisum sativum]